MALQKTITADRIEVVNGKFVQIRTKTAIMENGEQLSASYHRHVVVPGQDFSKESDQVKAICAAVHTPEVVAQYQKEQAALAA